MHQETAIDATAGSAPSVEIWEHAVRLARADLVAILDGRLSLPDAGARILEQVLELSSGRPTKAEITGYTHTMGIYTSGPAI
jgi:altronate dehydratase large subunit